MMDKDQQRILELASMIYAASVVKDGKSDEWRFKAKISLNCAEEFYKVFDEWLKYR